MDLISRQEAIEALAEHIMESALMDNPTTASTDIDSYRPIAELPLRDVPSVQPEKTQLSKEDATKGATFDCISRQAAIDALSQYPFEKVVNCISIIEELPYAQPEPISEEYAKAVRTWLINYQVRCAELNGRYTPYEILGWIVSDWRKENEIW